MSELICGGLLTSSSQFIGVPATKAHPAMTIYDFCGGNSASSAARWADQSLTTPSPLQFYQRMRGLGLGEDSGMSTLYDLETTLRNFNGTNRGYTIITPAKGQGVQDFINEYTGHAAVVWETGNGQALRDFITGLGEDARNLVRHFLTSLGKNTGGGSARVARTDLPQGMWNADGANDSQNLKNGVRYHWPINQRLVYYPNTVIAAAQPIGAFAVAPRVVVAPSIYPVVKPSPAPPPSPNPGGGEQTTMVIDLANAEVARYFTASGPDWHCQATGATIPAGPLLAFYRSFGGVGYCGLTYLGLPLENAQPIAGKAGATYQPFERGTLINDPAHIYDAPPGVTSAVYLGHVDHGDAQVFYANALTKPLEAEIAASHAQTATANTQLTEANGKLTAIRALL